jgi:lysophospholipase L1-like esterase
MKQILLYLFLLISTVVFSQRQLPFYNTAAGTLTQTGAGVNYVDVRINYSDQTGMTTGSTINSSCVLLYFNTDDNTGYELPVLSVTTPSSTNPVVRVDITGFPALNGAINGQGVIYKKSSSTHFAPFVSNASNSLQQVIQEAMTRDLNDALITGVDITKYVGSGAPAFTPASSEPKLAQGLASPYPFYAYNGSAWVLVGSGGSSNTFADSTKIGFVVTGSAVKGKVIANSLDSSDYKDGGIAYSDFAQTTKDSLKIRTTFLGTIYNKNSWVTGDLTTDFVNINTDASVVSNKIQITNGANTYTHVLSIRDTSVLEHFKFVAKIKLNAISGTTYGFGIGARGTNSHPTSLMTRIGFTGGSNDGKLYLDYGNSGGYANTLTTQKKVTASVNDYIILQLERDFFTVHATIWNATTNTTLADTSYTYTTTQVNPYMSNTCTYPIYSLGGSFTIDSLSLTSTEMVGADLALVGNSKVQGFNASRPQKRFASLLGQQYSVVALGGGYDYSSDIKKRVAEIISLKPKNVILCDITSNDQRVNGLTDSTNYYANVQYIDNTLTAAGITCYISLPMYETAIDQSKTVAWMQRTFTSNKLIDLWNPLKPLGMLDTDGTHPSDLGHKQIASIISNLGIVQNGNHNLELIDIPTAATLGLGTKAYNNQFDYTAATSTNANTLSNSGQTTIGYAFTNASNASAWHALTTFKSDTSFKQMVQYDDAFYSNAPRLARRNSQDGGATWTSWQTFAFIDQLGDRALTNYLKSGGGTSVNMDTLIHTTGQLTAGYSWLGTPPQAGGRHLITVLRDMNDSAQVVQYADGTYSAYRQARRISNNNGSTWGSWQKYVFDDQLSRYAYLDPFISNYSTAVNMDTATHITARTSYGFAWAGTPPNATGRQVLTVLRDSRDSAYITQYVDSPTGAKRMTRRVSTDNGATWSSWVEIMLRDSTDNLYVPYTGANKNVNLGVRTLTVQNETLTGLQAGATSDSIITSNAGLLRRMTINGMLGTTTSSLRVPRLTTTQRDATNGAAGSFTGDILYNSTTDTYQVADGTTSNWVDLATGTTTYFSGSYDNTIAAGSRDSVVITVSGLTTSTGAASVYYVALTHDSDIIISPARIETGQIKIYLKNINLVTSQAFSGILKVMVRRL